MIVRRTLEGAVKWAIVALSAENRSMYEDGPLTLAGLSPRGVEGFIGSSQLTTQEPHNLRDLQVLTFVMTTEIWSFLLVVDYNRRCSL